MRALAGAHLIFAVAMLPITVLGGILFFPLLLALPVWIGFLARRLWTGMPNALASARRTHYGLLVFDALLILWGFAALKAAEESAKRGGGLLGGFGFIPIFFGVVFGLFSLGMLLWIYVVTARQPDGLAA